MREIKTVTIIGANGTMGSGCAGIIAAFGNARVFMLSRSLDKAMTGIQKAVDSVRSDVILNRLVPGTMEDLPNAVASSDWVMELVAENYQAKHNINALIAKHRKPGTIVTSVTSGLSIEKLSESFDDDGKKHYFGSHFYNPPYKMLLCELIPHSSSDTGILNEFENYLHGTLLRKVVRTADSPAFIGNRIGFQFLNETAMAAERFQDKGGIALIDAILGSFTGRAMPPMATINMVGLDIHKAIVDNLYENTNDHAHSTFVLPAFIKHLIDSGRTGKKAGEGLYKTTQSVESKKTRLVYDIARDTYRELPTFNLPFAKEANRLISMADYRGAINIIKTSSGEEAKLCRYFLARYISYSLSLAGEIVDNRNSIDRVMGFGFNWVPPSYYVDLLGGCAEAIQFIKNAELPVPEELEKAPGSKQFYRLSHELDARSLFRAH